MHETSLVKIHWFGNNKILTRWAIIGYLIIFGSPLAYASDVSDLYGTWIGTWFVDEVRNEFDPPTPMAFPVDIQFNIGPLDSQKSNYGTMVLDTTTSHEISSITVVGNNVEMRIDYPWANYALYGTVTGVLSGITFVGDFDEEPAVGYLTGKGALEITKIPNAPTIVDLSGSIKTTDGTDICAMVLASGQYMFSCNPLGEFSLENLSQETNGTIKRQIYADGFFPKVDTLTDSTNESVVMTRSGTCPNYNANYDAGFVPNSAGKRINITGKVLLQNSQTPICAMVLANGQHMFSCDGTGSYALNIPLDKNGQYKLQVYAEGFAPITQIFDEFNITNNVRMARVAECQ